MAEGADFQKLPDGRVELIGRKKHTAGMGLGRLAASRIGRVKWSFSSTNRSPAAVFFLGDDQGPRYQVGFFKEAQHGQTSFFPSGSATIASIRTTTWTMPVAPMSLPRPWFRLVFGCGTFKVWTSWTASIGVGLSIRWSTNRLPTRIWACTACVGQQRKSIKLRHVQLRELATLDWLAPAAAPQSLGQAPAADMDRMAGSGLGSAAPDADSAEWRRACAIRTLAAGTTAGLGPPLVDSLLDKALQDHKPIAAQIELLDEAALLCHTWDDPSAALRFAQRYRDIGRRAHREGQTRPCSLDAKHAQRTAPIWSRQVYNSLPDRLVRTELSELTQAAAGRRSRFLQRTAILAPLPAGNASRPRRA